jgi:hypothetical protein
MKSSVKNTDRVRAQSLFISCLDTPGTLSYSQTATPAVSDGTESPKGQSVCISTISFTRRASNSPYPCFPTFFCHYWNLNSVSHAPSPFCFSYFSDKLLHFCMGVASDSHPTTSASQIAEITGMNLHTQLVFEIGSH